MEIVTLFWNLYMEGWHTILDNGFVAWPLIILYFVIHLPPVSLVIRLFVGICGWVEDEVSTYSAADIRMDRMMDKFEVLANAELRRNRNDDKHPWGLK